MARDSGLGYGTKYVRVRVRVRVRARVSGLHTVAYDSLMRPWRPLTYITCVVTGVFSCVFLLLGVRLVLSLRLFEILRCGGGAPCNGC